MMLGPETKLKACSYRLAEEPVDNLNWLGKLQTSHLFKEWMLSQRASAQTSLWEKFVSVYPLWQRKSLIWEWEMSLPPAVSVWICFHWSICDASALSHRACLSLHSVCVCECTEHCSPAAWAVTVSAARRCWAGLLLGQFVTHDHSSGDEQFIIVVVGNVTIPLPVFYPPPQNCLNMVLSFN